MTRHARLQLIDDGLLILVLALTVGACCALGRALGGRDCYPACPPAPPARVVTVERTCTLPPTLELPPVALVEQGCPPNLTCLDAHNAGNLAQRESSLKGWIREARARCGPPPDAGSGPGGDAAPGR